MHESVSIGHSYTFFISIGTSSEETLADTIMEVLNLNSGFGLLLQLQT